MFNLAASCQAESRQIHIGRAIRIRIQEASSLQAIVFRILKRQSAVWDAEEAYYFKLLEDWNLIA